MTRRTVAWIWMAAVVGATLWAYANSFTGVLVLDDDRAIAQNPYIRSLGSAFTAPADTTLSGRPVASLTFALNYAMGATLWSYHAVNVLIHVLAALALFGVVRRTLESPRLRTGWAPVAIPLAGATAMIWALHPLQTESVTYLVQRVESLMGLCALVSLYAAIRAIDDRRRTTLWSVGAVVFCALGLGAKTSMVAIPVIVALWDWCFSSADREPPRWRIPLYSALAATWVVAVVSVALAPRTASVGVGLRGWTSWSYLLTQAGVIAHYVKLTFVPEPLVILYDWPPASLAAVALPFAGLVLLVVVTALGLTRRHPLAFAGAWFLLLLAPTSSVIPIATEVAAEHRMYLPLAAVVAAVVCGVVCVRPRFIRQSFVDAAAVVATGAVIAAVVLGWTTRARNEDYQHEERLWAGAIAAQPQSPRALAGRGILFVRQGRYADAEKDLASAVTLEPENALTQQALGAALVGQQRFADAVPHLEHALSVDPNYDDAHYNLGLALAVLGRNREALPHLERALVTHPNDRQLREALAHIKGGQP